MTKTTCPNCTAAIHRDAAYCHACKTEIAPSARPPVTIDRVALVSLSDVTIGDLTVFMLKCTIASLIPAVVLGALALLASIAIVAR